MEKSQKASHVDSGPVLFVFLGSGYQREYEGATTTL